ncbi:uncharacterized protein LOC110013122 [Sesamum indicum]|uniref:Uncharacterized protein LOC110013122 n=1 Tax=Sesamum indicum TaxID=4182 RepID=A0A8M8VE70_SESIN|nr:uncharacterized protein LOC110013122 [Sesamum indicum]
MDLGRGAIRVDDRGETRKVNSLPSLHGTMVNEILIIPREAKEPLKRRYGSGHGPFHHSLKFRWVSRHTNVRDDIAQVFNILDIVTTFRKLHKESLLVRTYNTICRCNGEVEGHDEEFKMAMNHTKCRLMDILWGYPNLIVTPGKYNLKNTVAPCSLQGAHWPIGIEKRSLTVIAFNAQ